MVQKTTLLTVADKSGVEKVNTFHIYGGGNRRIGKVGSFLKVSVRAVEAVTKLKLKSKIISILVRSKFRYQKCDGSSIYSDVNICVLLKKRLTPVGKEIHGPIYKRINRKKFLASFSGVI